jgi:hypothetical protein
VANLSRRQNKREQNLNDVGAAITSIGAEALKERKITSREDIAGIGA